MLPVTDRHSPIEEWKPIYFGPNGSSWTPPSGFSIEQAEEAYRKVAALNAESYRLSEELIIRSKLEAEDFKKEMDDQEKAQMATLAKKRKARLAFAEKLGITIEELEAIL